MLKYLEHAHYNVDREYQAVRFHGLGMRLIATQQGGTTGT